MKQLTMSDVKERSFNLVRVIESLSSFDLNNKDKTKKEVSEAIYESESLVEAIIFKREKLKKGTEDQKEKILVELTNALKENISGSYLGHFDNSFSILNLKKKKDELVRIRNIIRYSLQMKGQEEKVLQSLLDSEDVENWLLLAHLINCNLVYSKGTNLAVFSAFSKKLEILVIDTFRQNISNEDFSGCKTCFDILKILGKEYILLDEFLVHRELITTSTIINPPILSKFNLTSTELQKSEFEDFLNEKLALIEESYHIFYSIFGTTTDYNDHIINKVFKTLIYRNLHDFLSANNAPVFLMCIESAYNSLIKFTKSLKVLFPTIKVETSVKELVSSFTYNSIYHEKVLFEELLDIQLQGTSTLNKYTVNEIEVSKTFEYEKIFEIMSIVIEKFLNRSKILYSNEEEADLLEIFIKKIGSIVDLMISATSNQLSVINSLIKVYKVFFGKSNRNHSQFKSLKKKIQSSIEVQFESFIELSIQQFKRKISNLNLKESKGNIDIITYIDAIFQNTALIDEKNINILSFRLFSGLYEIIYKHVLSINSLSDSKIKNLHIFLDEIYKSFPVSSSSELLNRIRRFKKFSELLISDPLDFELMLTNAGFEFNKEELNDIKKYRESRTCKSANSLK